MKDSNPSQLQVTGELLVHDKIALPTAGKSELKELSDKMDGLLLIWFLGMAVIYIKLHDIIRGK